MRRCEICRPRCALTAEGILRSSAINEIFSRIRFFFMMKPFARKFQLSPVTEMEIEPLLFQMSRALEQARAAIENALRLPEPLPLQLSIPDLSQFIGEFFGVEQEKSRLLADELAGPLLRIPDRRLQTLRQLKKTAAAIAANSGDGSPITPHRRTSR